MHSGTQRFESAICSNPGFVAYFGVTAGIHSAGEDSVWHPALKCFAVNLE
jgi:hypothetical protein